MLLPNFGDYGKKAYLSKKIIKKTFCPETTLPNFT
jgi:hypothetical protein